MIWHVVCDFLTIDDSGYIQAVMMRVSWYRFCAQVCY